MTSLCDMTVAQLRRGLDEGRFTSVDITMACLSRIARYNHEGPAINAVLEVNPDALHIAAAEDARRAAGHASGPLSGIPVLIKDNIATDDGMHTSAGSLALADCYAAADATLVRRLREAGCVLLGKTNLTEWANFMTDNMPNGFSSRGGQVHNPYGPGTLDVGGSSSGSGAAVAVGFAPLAVGTETSGSILSPASSNSVVGIKPTVGLISRTGIVPIAHSQDTAGPMARTVADAAALLALVAAADPNDPVTQTGGDARQQDYLRALDPKALTGARLGIVREPYFSSLDADVSDVMERALTDLRACGAEIVDGLHFDLPDDWQDYTVLLYEFKSDLNRYLGHLPATAKVHSLADVIAFNDANALHALQHGQTLLLAAQALSGRLTERVYIEARQRDLDHSRTRGIDRVLADHRLDALVFPANYGAGIAARAGYPSVCVPGGYTVSGRPVGVTFTGTAWTESRLIGLAYAYEQSTQRRTRPDFLSE